MLAAARSVVAVRGLALRGVGRCSRVGNTLSLAQAPRQSPQPLHLRLRMLSSVAGGEAEGLPGAETRASVDGLISDPGSAVADAIDQSLSAAQLADPLPSELGYGPIDMATFLLDTVHTVSGEPWWVSILIFTVGIRAALIPMTIFQMRNGMRMKVLNPLFQELKDKMDRREISPQEFTRQLEILQQRHGVRFSHTFGSLFVQMPIFLTMFWTLQRMSTDYPSFSQGGALWFTDLAQADPTYILPLVTSAGFIATMELGFKDAPQRPGQGEQMKWAMRGLGLITVPISMTMPTSVLVYWSATNAFTLLQTLFFKLPGVKETFGITLKQAADGSVPDAPIEPAPAAKALDDQPIFSAPPSSSRRSRLRKGGGPAGKPRALVTAARGTAGAPLPPRA